MKVRNQKSEIRKKVEPRNPKWLEACLGWASNWGKRPGLWLFYGPRSDAPRSHAPRRRFGLRISAFFRPSGFGFRVLSAALSILAVPLAFAATNSTSSDSIPPLRPPHPEIPPDFWEQHGWWVVLGGLLALALVGAAVWLLTRPKPPVVVPPEIEARHALEALRHQAEDGLLLSRVSQILRRYVAARFSLPPEQLTTTEFCRALAANEQIGPELSGTFADFLRLSDQRKFAPAAPLPPLGAVAQALKLIDEAEARRTALAQATVQSAADSTRINPPETGGHR
jgi:hypothetical protein